MIRAVLFDFDLTLADSSTGVIVCANDALSALGFPHAAPDLVRRTIGLTLTRSFEVLSGNTDTALAAAYATHFMARADCIMEPLIEWLPGATAALRQLRQRDLRIAIVSTKMRYRIEAVLNRDGLRDAVDVVGGAEDVVNHKPHPDGIHHALRALHIDRSQGLYAGDHIVDAQAAAAADVPFVAVLSGLTPRQEWERFEPVALIESVADLPATLADLVAERRI